jgi:predicted membrane protein
MTVAEIFNAAEWKTLAVVLGVIVMVLLFWRPR